jgi:tetratricopeptide (TPR) repeat protein
MQPNDSPEPVPQAIPETPATEKAQMGPASKAAPSIRGAKIVNWTIAVAGVLSIAWFVRVRTAHELSVESLPSGASVFIDGRLVGRTPVRISGLDAGAYSVRFERENCAPLSVPAKIGWGTTYIRQVLTLRGEGSLKVDIEPANAEVVLDGEMVGHTPLELSQVPVGTHDLLIRKTNFKTYSTRFTIEKPGDPKEFKDFVLEDLVLAMLQKNIDLEPQRVAHYTDMGHYLFANNKLKEAGDFYVRGLEVSGEELTFAPGTPPEERNLEGQLRERERERHYEEIRKKLTHVGPNRPEKDIQKLQQRIEEAHAANADHNPKDWTWVREQARNFIEQRKFDKAEMLYQRHIQAAKGVDTVAQAHINLIMLRIIYMQRAPEALVAIKDFAATPYSNVPQTARQAANAIYSNAGSFPATDRTALLAQAEMLLRRALANSPKHTELSALCKFELGNVLAMEGRPEEADVLYRDSVIESQEPTNKELRNKRRVETLKQLKRVDDAREILTLLVKSPRDEIKNWAAGELKTLDAGRPGVK